LYRLFVFSRPAESCGASPRPRGKTPELNACSASSSPNLSAANLNRLTAIGGAALGYDLRHNIALVPAAASGTGSAATYLYNSENMLVGGGGIALAYDPLMRLYQVGATRWAYDSGSASGTQLATPIAG